MPLNSFAVVYFVMSAVGAHEVAVRSRAFGVHDAFRNTLAVEVRHLFKQQKVFKNHRAARAYGQRVLVVADRSPGVGSHEFRPFNMQIFFFLQFFLFFHDSSPQLKQTAANSWRIDARFVYFQYIVQIRWIGTAYD